MSQSQKSYISLETDNKESEILPTEELQSFGYFSFSSQHLWETEDIPVLLMRQLWLEEVK